MATFTATLALSLQKRTTKLIPALKNLPYKDHLKACNMSTLHYRRVRGDMIETYKILSRKYDTNVAPNLTTGIQATQGDLRIFKIRFKYDLCKFYFTNRVVELGVVWKIGLLWLTVLHLLNAG